MRPATGVSWVVENYGVTVTRPAGALFLSIPYPYAALWALIADGNYRAEFASRLLATLVPTDEQEAGHVAQRTLQQWIEEELVTLTD